jgi:hypothetical protein
MKFQTGQVLAMAMVVGLIAGGWTERPVSADDLDCTGCCATTQDCGGPNGHRCCLPKSGEAPCCPDPNPNYCFDSNSCSIQP